MKYKILRNEKYDFLGQSYATIYPNLHKYPATMLPQIGIELFKELNIKRGVLLDPYCGSGSSFACGLECGLTEMHGFDINPLAVLISKVRFTKVSVSQLVKMKDALRNNICEFLKKEENVKSLNIPEITNINFWFSKKVIRHLTMIKHFINKISNEKVRNFFWIPFSETVRECSYTRNNEFKLFRMKEDDLLHFNPDVIGVYFDKLNNVIDCYNRFYYPKLHKEINISVQYSSFSPLDEYFDTVLTSPPYGDSHTTVAYGQFSTLSNEWLGVDYARKIDKMLMGGIKLKENINDGLITDYISKINKVDKSRALEVSAFYQDLGNSVQKVAKSIRKGGKSIYVVGNRTVKMVQLPTDQFIAEKFEQNGFKHLITYERAISNKSMPLKNSPSNISGRTINTMLYEYIVVSEKVH